MKKMKLVIVVRQEGKHFCPKHLTVTKVSIAGFMVYEAEVMAFLH